MKTAVVILNWNGKSLLQKFLPSVISYSPPNSVYVIDNCSNDNSVECLKTQFPHVHIIQNEKNYGFAKGYNEGLKQIKAQYFLLLNSDIEVTQNWLEPLEKLLDENEMIAACQPKILSFLKPNEFEHAGAAGGFIDKWGYSFCRGRIFNITELDENQYNKDSEIFWASGASMLIRSTLFFKLHGFDENFFAHMEEIDLCWRLKNEGYKIGFSHASKVLHVGGATLNYASPNKTYLNFRNNLLMMMKNLPHQNLFRTLFIRMLLDGLAGIKFITEFKFLHFMSVIKAHISFYILFRTYYNKRNKNIPQSLSCVFVGSIISEFFLKKKKKFSQLDINRIS
jgi:GT2 family glycosyltransferase